MTRIKILVISCLAALAMTMTACDPPPPAYPPTAMPTNATYTGAWHSEHWGRILLTQRGDEVSGRFNMGKGDYFGEISGTLDGGVLVFTWVRRGDMGAGGLSVRGKGYAIVDPENENLKGEWGLNERRQGGQTNRKVNEGKWEAYRQSNDPDE